MRIAETFIHGLYDVAWTSHADARGSFARLYDPIAVAEAGIDFVPADVNLSRNPHYGTLRGLHYQDPPYAESKLVRTVAGRIYDVVVDLREESGTRGRWLARELSAENGQGLLIPQGCAHGFLTLEPRSDVLYLMGQRHRPGHGKGFRYDDPAFAIEWPDPPTLLSEADLAWPPYRDGSFAAAQSGD